MTHRLAAGDEAGARSAQNRAIEFALLLAVPCVIGFLVVPGLIMRALFMRGAHWAHYHLSGRLQGGHNAAGDLLLHAGAAWAAENRCSLLHLGGGHSSAADDPLLAFKRRIGRAATTAAFAGIVCLPAVHARLTSAWEAAAGRQASWFQGYREPHRGVPDGQ